MNSFPALTAPSPLISISNLFIAFKAILLTNSGKLSLAKGIAAFGAKYSRMDQVKFVEDSV